MSVPLFFGNPITMMISNQIDRHNTDIISSSLIDLLNEIIGIYYYYYYCLMIMIIIN